MFKSATFTRVLGIVGESLITLGVIVLLFLAWQLWINDAVVAHDQQVASGELEKKWQRTAESQGAPAVEDFGAAPAFPGVGIGEDFATIFIPRLGADSTRVATNSIDVGSALDKGYYGHYEQTQWPGQSGNFALAIHRTGNGSPFGDSPQLQAGDKIYVQTEQGYYTYAFRNYEYVLPTGVDVLLPLPGGNGVTEGQSIITITTCNPLLGDAERMIVYGVLESWRPTDAGPPPAMKKAQKVDS